jgi:hypothetical protein
MLQVKTRALFSCTSDPVVVKFLSEGAFMTGSRGVPPDKKAVLDSKQQKKAIGVCCPCP